MKNLVGCKIKAILVSPGQEYLVFETDKGRKAYYADGDCCSHSWFSGVTGVDTLIGHRVTGVEEVDLGEVNDSAHDCLSLYGIKITTDGGRADVEFRNSSNGYYGGSCDPTTVSDVSAYVEITDDWSGTVEPD